jgi:glutathione S-transferase
VTPVGRGRLVGGYVSPYVRKVLFALHAKGVAYEIDPIVPFFGGDGFTAISPVRRIPVWIDDQVTLPDSTAICEYLDDRWPDPPLRPASAADRARARWLEEYADTRIGEVIIWRLFDQLVIGRFVWGRTPDEAIVKRAQEEELPAILDFLERELPAEGFLFGAAPMTADVSIASFFRNAAFARTGIDASRWPRSAAFVARTLALPELAKLRPFEELSLRTPIAEHRAALAQAGAPVSAETLATATPRRGVLST